MRQPRQPKSLNGRQRYELGLVQPELQKVNAIAALHLLRLYRLRHDEREVTRICDDLSEIVRRGNVLIECCNQILVSDTVGPDQPIEVKVGVSCENCEMHQYRRPQNEGPRIRPRAGWMDQIQVYIGWTTSLTAFMFKLEGFVNRSRQVTNCIRGARKMFVRQHLYLQEITPERVPPVHVRIEKRNCIYCGAEVP